MLTEREQQIIMQTEQQLVFDSPWWVSRFDRLAGRLEWRARPQRRGPAVFLRRLLGRRDG